MNFDKAHKELMNGKKIRRKEWEVMIHLRLIEDEVVAFRGEHKAFYDNPNILISSGWKIVDGDETEMTFVEAIEVLKSKKCIYRNDMSDAFMFIDNDHLATCSPVEFDFMPTWKCLLSNDWEIIK
jgi:hypothetical protein